MSATAFNYCYCLDSMKNSVFCPSFHSSILFPVSHHAMPATRHFCQNFTSEFFNWVNLISLIFEIPFTGLITISLFTLPMLWKDFVFYLNMVILMYLEILTILTFMLDRDCISSFPYNSLSDMASILFGNCCTHTKLNDSKRNKHYFLSLYQFHCHMRVTWQHHNDLKLDIVMEDLNLYLC